MNAIMNKTMEKRKLLAAIAVLALAMCAFVAFVPASETDAVAATNVPAVGEDGKITVDEVLTLDGDATITNGLVLNAALTIPETATLTINYAFQASETGTNESVITFGTNGQLIVEGKVIINASNESGYTPGEKATNHILFKEGGYSSTADIQVNSGSLEMNMDKAVKGALNNGKFYLDVDGGNVKFNGNSVTTMYIVQDGGSIEFVQNDGSVMAYIDMNGGSMTVSGTNTTGSAADTPNPYIFVPYAMDIASGATLNVNGAMSIYTKVNGALDATLPEGHGLTISTVKNAGKINVNASGSIDVPTGATMELGTINSSGNVDVTVDENGIEDALKNPAVDSIVYTGTTAPTTAITKELTVTNASAINGATVGENGAVTLAPAEDKETVEIDTTGITVNYATGGSVAIKATSDKFTASSIEFYYGSEGVIINDSTADATITYDSTTGKIQGTITSGTVTISGTGTVTIDRQGLTLGNNATLVIDDDITLKAGSNLKVDKDATVANLTVEGVLEYTSIPDIVKVTGNGTIKVEGGQGTENIISVSQDVNGTYYLTADTTILSGVTLTVPRNAVLNLMGYDLIVEGTLVVENRGTVTSGVGAVDSSKVGNIVLTTTGAIQNEGTIGDRMPISIANGESYDQTDKVYTQTVTVQGVSGINFQLIRSIDDGKRVYDMAVSGEVSAVKGAAESSVTLKNVDINGNMTVDDNIDFTIAGTTEITGNGTVFTFNGDKMTTTDGTFILTNGTSAVLNSEVVGKIYAQTGYMGDDGKLVADVTTNTPAVPVTYVEFVAPTGQTSGANNNATAVGMTISVSKVTVVEKDKSVIYQRMFVSGDIDAAIVSTSEAKDVVGNATVNFAGEVYIAESLTFTEDVTVNKAGYTLMVSAGGVVEVVSAADPELVYNGAKYVIEAEKSSDPDTYYYTTFAGAMQNIATAADGIVTVNGDFTISGTYTVADNQEINVEADSVADKVKVGEGAVITVEVGGYIDNSAIYQILGKVVVLEGDGYEPVAQNADGTYVYAVMTEDAETLNVTYSGLKTALDEATAGQTIEVVGSTTYDGDLVVINGVTLKVNEGLTLTVTGDVTVENGGKLILDASTLAVGEAGENGAEGSENVVTVAGELDASEAVGITAVYGAKSVNIYSTGKITSATAIGGGVVKMNAAYYNDGEFVYTSLANAVAYAEENALPTGVNVTGTFTETGAVESDGVSIVVDNGANVTLGDLTLNNAKISSAAATAPAVQGTYTATITALNGAGDAATNATVAVSKTTATVESKVTLNAEGTSQYALQINGLANANIQAGTVTYIGGSFTVNKENGLTVSSGATLLIGENATLTNKDAVMVNNGTIEVAEKKTLTVEGTLAGNVNVPKDATLKSVADGMTITGTVTVDAQGTFQADGKLQMGAAPELLTDTAAGAVVGKLILTDNEAYIVAFAGADLSQADIVLNGDVAAELKNTAYQINGIDFVTVYTFGSIDIDGTTGNAVYNAVKGLKDLNTDAEAGKEYDIVWYAGETKITNEKIGEYAQVSTEIRYRTVEVTVSEGPAITVSIDGVVWNGVNPVKLTIGTHTVSAVVDPGYTGTIQITFNGQAVTNGQFEITSDMLNSIEDIVLSASGNITQDSTVVVDGGSSGSGEMGLTDYLLIILVILIVVMAIMVAMRLMRS